jgi:LysR family transcriptional regulator, glycine cleavage system transcriptional activator
MKRIPPINCLETFEVLARVRSMKKAAEVLCVSPSAVSHRIRLMEQILDRPLFEGEGFTLSEESEQYLKVVRESLILLQSHSFQVKSCFDTVEN